MHAGRLVLHIIFLPFVDETQPDKTGWSAEQKEAHKLRINKRQWSQPNQLEAVTLIAQVAAACLLTVTLNNPICKPVFPISADIECAGARQTGDAFDNLLAFGLTVCAFAPVAFAKLTNKREGEQAGNVAPHDEIKMPNPILDNDEAGEEPGPEPEPGPESEPALN